MPTISIEPLGVTIPDDATYNEWENAYNMALSVHNASKWAIGDLILWGETRWGERYANALDHTKLKYETLKNYVYISRAFPREQRHIELSWSHHYQVAKLEEHVREELLLDAIAHNMSVEDLKDVMRARHLLPEKTTAELPAGEVVHEVNVEPSLHWHKIEGHWEWMVGLQRPVFVLNTNSIHLSVNTLARGEMWIALPDPHETANDLVQGAVTWTVGNEPVPAPIARFVYGQPDSEPPMTMGTMIQGIQEETDEN